MGAMKGKTGGAGSESRFWRGKIRTAQEMVGGQKALNMSEKATRN